jgi:hypothetical protein
VFYETTLQTGYFTRDVADWHLAIYKAIPQEFHLLDLTCIKACNQETLCNMFVYDGITKVCYIAYTQYTTPKTPPYAMNFDFAYGDQTLAKINSVFLFNQRIF